MSKLLALGILFLLIITMFSTINLSQQVFMNSTTGMVEKHSRNYQVHIFIIGIVHDSIDETVWTDTWESIYVHPPSYPEHNSYSYLGLTVEDVWGVDRTDVEGFEKWFGGIAEYDSYTYEFLEPRLSFDTDGSARIDVYAKSDYLLELTRDITVKTISWYIKYEGSFSIMNDEVKLNIWPPPAKLGFDEWGIIIYLDNYTPLEIEKIIDPDGRNILGKPSYKMNSWISSLWGEHVDEMSIGLYSSPAIPLSKKVVLLPGSSLKKFGEFTIHFAKSSVTPFVGIMKSTARREVVPANGKLTINADTPDGGIFRSLVIEGEFTLEVPVTIVMGTTVMYRGNINVEGERLIFEKYSNSRSRIITFSNNITIINKGSDPLILDVYTYYITPLEAQYSNNIVYINNTDDTGYVFFGSPILDPILIESPLALLMVLFNHQVVYPILTISAFQDPMGIDLQPYWFYTKNEQIYGGVLNTFGFASAVKGTYRILVKRHPINFFVKDNEGNPLEDAKIEIYSINTSGGLELAGSGLTNSKGLLSISPDRPGPYIVRASRSDYSSKEVYVDLADLRNNKQIEISIEKILPAVRFKGLITKVSSKTLTVRVTKILNDQANKLDVDTLVEVTYEGFAKIDKVNIGDTVEINGTFNGISNGIVQISLHKPEHYLKKVETKIPITLKNYTYKDEVPDALSFLLEYLGIKEDVISGRFYIELEPIDRIEKVEIGLSLGYIPIEEFAEGYTHIRHETKIIEMKRINSGFESRINVNSWWPMNILSILAALKSSNIIGFMAEKAFTEAYGKTYIYLTGDEPIYLTAEITNVTVIDIDGNAFVFNIGKELKTAYQKLIETFHEQDMWMYISVYSPVGLSVLDPDGKRVGYYNGKLYNEIEGAFYSGYNLTFQFIIIPKPKNGEYKVEVEGLKEGTYTLYGGIIEKGNFTISVNKANQTIKKGVIVSEPIMLTETVQTSQVITDNQTEQKLHVPTDNLVNILAIVLAAVIIISIGIYMKTRKKK